MKQNKTGSSEIGIDLLLAGSDAFKLLAEEMAEAHDRWRSAGAEPATLEWARRLAAHAGWWCGRLEAEADAVFTRADGMSPGQAEACRRRRTRPHR